MRLLDSVGAAKPLDDLGINIFGHLAGSYTYNFEEPDDDINVGRVFDFEHDEAIFNQGDITVERVVDVKKWDLGGRMEWIWGADSGLIHSNGLFDWYDTPRDPENQWDLNQLYADIGIPIGNGLRIRFGKFVTLLGWEVINPTGNALYSHSYSFGFGIPFTHTGILATYSCSDAFTFNAGITRGWEQSWEDSNDAVDFLGGFTWVINDKWTFILNNPTGPQQADNESDYRLVFNPILQFKVSDKWSLVADGVIGWEENVVDDDDDGEWYGVALYSMYTINDQFTFNARGEWFDDDDGARGLGTTVFEITLGLAITPFPSDPWGSNLKIRPEIRYDFADDDIFDGGGEDEQFTAAVDVIITL